MAAAEGKNLSQIRKNIEDVIEVAEVGRRRKLFERRMGLARSGIEAFQKKNYTQAIACFQTYLKLLEELKGVRPGGLTPANFDLKKDLPELLVLSGVYWDLVKIYDHTKAAEHYKEFLVYMEKYILFSKGMPFETYCAEILRRHISHNSPRHRKDFASAYQKIGTSKCFVATALIDVIHPDTMPRLRDFRDQVLAKSLYGKGFIYFYNAFGPWMARVVIVLPNPIRQSLGSFVDWIADQTLSD